MLESNVYIALQQRLIEEEGFKNTAYYDMRGILTIGIGHRVQPKDGISIGVRISDYFVLTLFHNDLLNCMKLLEESPTVYLQLDDVRKSVLIDLCYNLGYHGLQEFHKMWAALTVHDYDKAAAELLNSSAAHMLPIRYAKLANMLKTEIL